MYALTTTYENATITKMTIKFLIVNLALSISYLMEYNIWTTQKVATPNTLLYNIRKNKSAKTVIKSPNWSKITSFLLILFFPINKETEKHKTIQIYFRISDNIITSIHYFIVKTNRYYENSNILLFRKKNPLKKHTISVCFFNYILLYSIFSSNPYLSTAFSTIFNTKPSYPKSLASAIFDISLCSLFSPGSELISMT